MLLIESRGWKRKVTGLLYKRANNSLKMRDLSPGFYRFSFLVLLLTLGSGSSLAETRFDSQVQAFTVRTINDNLKNPWSMVFLSSFELLISEKAGALQRLSLEDGSIQEISGLPEVKLKGQGGLMGLALHPDFINTRWLYMAYTAGSWGEYGTEVLRARLEGDQLLEQKVIFRAAKKSSGGRHFGSRLLFDQKGQLFISLGDRGSKKFAQDLNDHRGSLVRLNDDGSVPEDNPFISRQRARAEIYSLGHRNIQGLAMQASGQLWAHEHGPQGGDELNLIEAGSNYGWPVITYGVNYGIGTRIGEGTHKEGMQQPAHKWIPSIAPSGMVFYRGERFPGWKDNLFVGSLKFGQLVRLQLNEKQVIHEERLLDNKFGRIRDVAESPDGYLYLLTDAARGKLLKLIPLNDN